MANIFFAMYPEFGHLYTSFGLAQKLLASNHDISYLGIPDSEEIVRSKGFEFKSIFEDIFPAGSTYYRIPNQGTSRLWEQINAFKYQKTRNKKFFDFLFTEDIDQLLLDISPDLFIVDSSLPFLALCAYRNGISTLMLSVTLQERSKYLPPLTSSIIPSPNWYNRLMIRLSWENVFIRKSLLGILRLLFGIDLDFPKLLQELAESADYQIDKINTITTLMPGINMLELIMCPEVFDFTRKKPDYMRYIGLSLPAEENADQFPWERLDQDIPLIFCTLGSSISVYSNHRNFIQTLIDSIGNRSNWQLVVGVGTEININNFNNPHSNVILVNWAPYESILKRSSIMINHGGLGSVKQCIYYGVPMIIFPLGRDQPGNAARIKYHGLGLVGDPRRITDKYFNDLIDTIQSDDTYKQRTEEMGVMFREIEIADDGVKFINELLS